MDGAEHGALRFIEAVEVWTPDESGARLTLASGIYGGLSAFAETAQSASFAKGEGLPGRAWAEGRPVLIDPLEGSGFVRIEAAAKAGLTCAAAIPVFDEHALKGVLVMLCARDETRTGAVEIWSLDTETPGALSLEAGFYGAADAFADVSRKTRFGRGVGLPGGVWAARAAMLLRNLSGSSRFVRAEAAQEAGLVTGLGMPLDTPEGETVAVTLLSSRAAPIAGRFEIWEAIGGAGPDARDMILTDGLCEREGPLWGKPKRVKAWSGPIGRVAATGVPIALGAGEAAGLPAGWTAVAALPIHRDGRLVQIAAWYF